MKRGDIVQMRSARTYLRPEKRREYTEHRAKPGHAILMMCLGTVAHNTRVDPLERIERMGWYPATIYEVSVELTMLEDEDTPFPDRIGTSITRAFSAPSVPAAVDAAVRFAEHLRGVYVGEEVRIGAVTINPLRVGPINGEGESFDGRGMSFFVWKAGGRLPLALAAHDFKEKLDGPQDAKA